MKSLIKHLPAVWLTLAFGLIASTIAITPTRGTALQLDRGEVAGGEVWRLATCHVTHWNLEHLAWDLLMFVVLGAACELRNPRRMWWCVAATMAAVTGVVLFCFPEIGRYRGLSGIDTALFVLLAVEIVRDAAREKKRLVAVAAGLLLVGFAAKTTYEAITGQTYFVDQQAAGFVPLVWDHVVASVIGAIAAFWPELTRPARVAVLQIWTTVRRSAAKARTSSSVVSQEHIRRAPPAPMNS
jgi:rhomboid family GlyGly-CTERM serine protease